METKIAIVIAQIAAFAAYFIGSRRFYRKEEEFLTWLGIGIGLDIMVVIVMAAKLINQGGNQGSHNILFFLHAWASSLGLLGFIILFSYVLIKGAEKEYERLRVFQYRILLPLWCLGVGIALANFISEVIMGFGIYG